MSARFETTTSFRAVLLAALLFGLLGMPAAAQRVVLELEFDPRAPALHTPPGPWAWVGDSRHVRGGCFVSIGFLDASPPSAFPAEVWWEWRRADRLVLRHGGTVASFGELQSAWPNWAVEHGAVFDVSLESVDALGGTLIWDGEIGPLECGPIFLDDFETGGTSLWGRCFGC